MKKLFPLFLTLALLLSACGTAAPAVEKDAEPKASEAVAAEHDEDQSVETDAGETDADEIDAGETDSGKSNAVETAPVETEKPTEEKYPVVDMVATDEMSLAETVCDTLTFSYPDEAWLLDETVEPPTFYCIETLESEVGVTNINVQVSVPVSGELSESDMESLCQGLTGQGMTIDASELRTLNGTPLIYIESTLEITDSLIDFLIEDGSWTEEYVESLGGREALTAIPPTTQVYYYVPIDGHLVILVGTYFGENSKQTTCDTMTIMAQTGKISG